MPTSSKFKEDYSIAEMAGVAIWWLLRFYDSAISTMMTVGVGHSRRYCNTGYDQSQGRRPSTLKCIGPISKGDIEPNHPSEINPNSDSRSRRSDGRSRRFVQYRVDQSQGQRPRSLLLHWSGNISSLFHFASFSNLIVVVFIIGKYSILNKQHFK